VSDDFAPALEVARQYWDGAADTFDNQADHGLLDPVARRAWAALLDRWLPPAPARVLDMGCGTGSLGVIAAELGHEVTGVDLSPRMLARARAKAKSSGQSLSLVVMDAARPAAAPEQHDAILCRHLLWTLPQPAEVMARWTELLRPCGRLVLIEGRWHTGAGLPMAEVVAALPPTVRLLVNEDLTQERELWGGEVSDERYVLVAEQRGIAP
jgi:2-polyprenyl-3-methyl-5-hydroxy-6-metoxy-1,4-benzoquinol methylase